MTVLGWDSGARALEEAMEAIDGFGVRCVAMAVRALGLVTALGIGMVGLAGNPSAAAEGLEPKGGEMITKRFHPIGVEADAGATVECFGIPFSPVKDGDGYRNMVTGQYAPIPVGRQFDAVYFLGMTTDRPEGNEGWGRWERYHDHGRRVYLGDRIGSILIFYDDPDVTLDTFPVIFGVNVWPYEMFTPLQAGEERLNKIRSPYREPFESDPAARRLLDDALIVSETDGPKPFRYVFGVRPRPKRIQSIWIRYEDFRRAHYVVSAATGVTAPPDAQETLPVPIYDQLYFLRQGYYPALDRLARRLYQFRDELPARVAPNAPAAYAGPLVRFEASPYAAILGNVYAHNVQDMAVAKPDPDGTPRTSTRGAPSFGHTFGFGTFREGVGTYHALICARDTGRVFTETIHAGYADTSARMAARLLHFLYDANSKYDRPSWKRVMNASEIGDSSAGITKENDGHGAIMLGLAALAQKGHVSRDFVQKNWKAFQDAADWFVWQMDHPAESGFDGVLCSRSEASYQGFGGFDLFSNTYAAYALRAFERLASTLGHTDDAARWRSRADALWQGLMNTFVIDQPRHGRIFTDINEDCWTYEYKRFAPLFALADCETLDPAVDAPDVYELARNTYAAQKEDYFTPASGREMGYGQGYLAQTAILLDQLVDARAIVEEAAAFCYHHADHNYLVPEGVIAHPSGRFWFRDGDLGNAVHQAEIVKSIRLLIGIDDLRPERGLRILPRLPDGWESLGVERWRVALPDGASAHVRMRYTRLDNGYRLEVEADAPLPIASLRFGPFKKSQTSFEIDAPQAEWTARCVGDSMFVYVAPGEGARSTAAITVRSK